MDFEYQLFSFSHPHKTRIEGLQLILSDLSHATRCIEIAAALRYGESEAFTIGTALQFQALISYYRCFGSGRRTPLPLDDVFKETPGLKEEHLFFRELRDKHIAHPVIKTEHNELVIAAKSADATPVGIGNYYFKYAGLSPEDMKRFSDLLRYVVTHAESTEKRLCEDLARDLFGDTKSWAEASEYFERVIDRERLYPSRPPTAD